MRRQFPIPLLLAACLLAASCLEINVSAQQASQPFERTLTVAELSAMDVVTGSGSIVVRGGASGAVRITGEVRVSTASGRSLADAEAIARELAANPPIELADGRLRIGRIEDPDLRRNVSLSFDITLPADTPVTATTGSGRIAVSGVTRGAVVRAGSGRIELENITGVVEGQTGSGSIRASGIAGAFTADTGSGSVVLDQTARGDVRASAGSGSLTLQGVDGALRARTGSGSIAIAGTPTGAWEVETGSGSIRLDLPDEAAFDLAARSGSGGVSTTHPVTISGRVRRNELIGQANGGGPQLQVRTGSGSISID